MSKLYNDNSINIKICGITSKETVKFLINNHVDYFGLIFYKKSPRYIDLNKAYQLTKISRDTKLKAVGVFVNYSLIEIQKYIDTLNLKFIQLHGNEDISYIHKLKKNNDVTIIKAFGIKDLKDFKIANEYLDVDYFLFDYKPTKNYELPGGNAKSFNWKITRNVKILKKWFLSGGINENNIKEAIGIKNLYGIDISSGVEEKLGVKSDNKISRILKIIKNTNEYKKQL